jgi:hypothetical protein
MEVDGINVVGCTAIARSGRRAEIRWRNLRRFFCSWDLGRDGAPRFDRADLRDRRVTMSLAGYWNDLFLGGFLDVIRRRIELPGGPAAASNCLIRTPFLRDMSRRVVRVEIGQKPGVVRGTGSSNPSPSSGESGANSTQGFGDLPPSSRLALGAQQRALGAVRAGRGRRTSWGRRGELGARSGASR